MRRRMPFSPRSRAAVAALAALAVVAAPLIVAAPASAAAVTIRINEVSSNPQDWVELVNTGATPVDLIGWRLVDNAGLGDPTHVQTLSATTIPAGGFVKVDYTAAGLGQGDSATLYAPEGTTPVDTTTWPAGTHAATWSRCPDGTGAFQATPTATPGAANGCAVAPPATPALDPNWDDIEVNEIASLNDDDPGNPGFGDAVELVNTGAAPVSIQGWYQTDSGAATGASPLTLAGLKVWDGDSFEPAASWIIPAGGYVAFSSLKGLSGEGDSVKIYGPGADAASRQLVDQQSYGDGDGGVSDSYESDSRAFAACPDGSDEFWRVTANSFGQDNTASCETKSRRLDTTVVLNEVSNVGGKAELLNTGTATVAIGGWELVDSQGDVVHAVPAGASLAAGAFYLAEGISGLESADSLTIRDTVGASVVAHTWYEDGIASYSRCELFGTISYVETPAATWGAANACPSLSTETWPGAATVNTVDAVDAFTDLDANDEGDVSGVAFDPNDPSILWVAMNKGRLFKMHLVGGLYTAFPQWDGGIPVRFADGGGELDAEGVTVGADGAVYLTSERDNLRAKGTSYNKIARYDVSAVTAGTTQLVATHEWDVNGFVTTGTNLGLEGITYVPDSFLTSAGWKVDGVAYRAADDATPGLFVTAVEGTGALHFFSLPVGGAPVEVKVEASGFPWSMDVAYDPDRKALWALCDDGCGGVYNLLTVTDGDFSVANSYARPSGMANLNNEGMAVAPASTCVGGFQQVIWADDGDTDGHSLRAGTLPCPVVPDTVRPETALVSPTTVGPFQKLQVRVDATDARGLQRIVANIYKDGTLVKSTQTAANGATSGSHTATVTLASGDYTVKYNAQDLAGNISQTRTFAFTIDATVPTATVKDGTSFTKGAGGVYDLVSFKLYDAGKIDRVTLNGVVKDLTDNVWSDVDYVKPGTFGAVRGQNVLVVYDVAGNSQTMVFTLN